MRNYSMFINVFQLLVIFSIMSYVLLSFHNSKTTFTSEPHSLVIITAIILITLYSFSGIFFGIAFFSGVTLSGLLYFGLIDLYTSIFSLAAVTLLTAGIHGTILKPWRKGVEFFYFSILYSYPAFLAYSKAYWHDFFSYLKEIPLFSDKDILKESFDFLGSLADTSTTFTMNETLLLAMIVGFGYLLLRYTTHIEGFARMMERKGTLQENVRKTQAKGILYIIVALVPIGVLFGAAVFSASILKGYTRSIILSFPATLLTTGILAAIIFLIGLILSINMYRDFRFSS